MNEAETRAELIDPALKDAGWGVVDGSRVRREVITLGRLQGAGKRAKQDIADYVLIYRGQKLAVIEAKKREPAGHRGRRPGQALRRDAAGPLCLLDQRRRHLPIDMETGAEGDVGALSHAGGTLGRRPLREARTTGATRFGEVPFEDKGGLGRRAITSTTPSTRRWRRLPPGATASC